MRGSGADNQPLYDLQQDLEQQPLDDADLQDRMTKLMAPAEQVTPLQVARPQRTIRRSGG